MSLLVPWAERLPAQLAITEIMSESSTNGMPAFKGPDFWELTNFGAEDINLDGYGFHDNVRSVVLTAAFSNLVIRAHESIIFCRSNPPAVFVDSTEKFIAWWGADNVPSTLRVRFYDRPGLNGDVGDELWLLDRSGQVVDMVSFGASKRGSSFTYDPTTGAFGVSSVAGVGLAFRAVSTSNDIGSPGITTGPVPLSIVQSPFGQIIDVCGDATFSVLVAGMPKPKCQWLHNGQPLPDEQNPSLTLRDVRPSDGGVYQVRVSNGLTTLASAPAILLVSTNPSPPLVVRVPVDAAVFPGQTARFSIDARGYPCLAYQWQSNRVDLIGETNPVLRVAVPSDARLGIFDYSVIVRNPLGSSRESARLTVMRRPCLRITEAMTEPAQSQLGHNDWFELTNCDTNAVNLQGYRFRDVPSLQAASEVTNAIVLRPGESAVFVEFMTPNEFRHWWGEENLPPNLQIITWAGWGLSSSGSDPISFWGPGADDPLDTIATALELAATPGVSHEFEHFCDATEGCLALYYRDSIPGESGAFVAAHGGDIGSPGYTSNPPPEALGVTLTPGGVQVRCRATPAKSYRLHFKNRLDDPVWTPLPAMIAEGPTLTFLDAAAGGATRRFYRVEELP